MSQIFDPLLAAVSPAGAAVSITLAGAAGNTDPRLIRQIHWGYDAAPAAGCTITVTDNGVTVFQLPVTSAGPGFTEFPAGKASRSVGYNLVVTLSAPGGSIKGYLTVA